MNTKVVVTIAANIEWETVCDIFKGVTLNDSPYGQWFVTDIKVKEKIEPIIFFRGGWGKVSAAGSTQYIIDHFNPCLLINLGTCGGFRGHIEREEIILVNRAIVYDILEEMGDPSEEIEYFTTDIDLSFLKGEYPHPVKKTLMLTGDRDLQPKEVEYLHETFGGVAGDWESGAIAWIAKRNEKKLLILRGVSDIVGKDGGEAYGQVNIFRENATKIMKELIKYLPNWIEMAI
ncbi:5'-methylthioadenosine/S-adenosylhomocysteine nucleosidase [Inediibacterium massiliense]|uniref:5'-methylthioadenosine/S-adenosylhomocysteine nucleosidase family protein n=1 Tax=Inediibacterium massiliense TaxID=1658111 RepID=UPI0006B5793D|nr:5'-methylthioadenosine/S-adenosylhomocysteine nucleosidase [Inediibacterium massiliense]